jgi:methylmalonyl-CoA mutase
MGYFIICFTHFLFQTITFALYFKKASMGKSEHIKLFDEFSPVSTQQWEEVIKDDLKGADYEKKLVWKTNEGIRVKPYYRDEDITNFPASAINTKPDGNPWDIRQDIWVYDIYEANRLALEAVERGATSIEFLVHSDTISKNDFSELVKDIHFGCIDFNLSAGAQTPVLVEYLIDEAKTRGYDLSLMGGSLHFDPLYHLAISGSYIKSELDDFVAVMNLLQKVKSELPKYRVIGISGFLFQECGGTTVQELGFSLAAANEYFSRLTELDLSAEEIAASTHFIFATGSNYFFEIAKLRAFRILWNNLVNAYNPGNTQFTKAYIHCTTQKWNMTVYDPYVNILRGTTEAMSAVLGGADSLSVRPFDSIYKKPENFSNRIARNTQIVLKEEVYFDRVADPAAGSYYIESLTNSIATEAWKIFQHIETEGGYIEALKKGIIQQEIEATAAKRNNDLTARKETLLGTNQFPDFNESMLLKVDNNVLNEKINVAKSTIIKPLKRFRAAVEFEALRLRTERSKKRPKVFMLTIGNLAMRLARSQFSSNFFAVAGFEVIDNNGFSSIDEGIKAALEAKSDIVVLCSSDEEYATLAHEAHIKLGNKSILVIAGAPACQVELEAKGITNFISIRSNILKTLEEYQKKLGIV